MNSIELFAGGGGLALGAANAGFRHHVVVDLATNAVGTLQANKERGVTAARDWEIRQADLQNADFRELDGAADYLFGGPPCQPFSTGGKHVGPQDVRNMFPTAIRAVGELQPRAFVFENVKGLLRKNFNSYREYLLLYMKLPTVSPRDGETWEEHWGRLQNINAAENQPDLQYRVHLRCMNAADYGVPQQRERVFIVGVRNDTRIEFSFPEPTHDRDTLLRDKWITGEYWDRHEIPLGMRLPIPDALTPRVARLREALPLLNRLPWRTVRDGIANLPRIGLGDQSREVANHYLNPGARSYPGHTGSEYDEPAKALKAGAHGVPGGENTLRLADGSVRYFSVRECARLQTYPDEWIFIGSWCACMRLLGNAVPVLLSEVVARQLARAIHEAEPRWAEVGTRTTCPVD